MAELKVATEVAEAEFQKLCELRRIDMDPADWNAEEVESFGKIKRTIVKAIQAGTLVVLDNGNAAYTPPLPDAVTLTFRRATGASFMSTDTVAKGKDMAKMCAIITEMTGCPPGYPSKLEAPDFNFCTKLVNLFLAQG